MTDPPPPRLLDRLRAALRARHYSLRTEESYVHWVRRFVLFHGKRHPDTMGGPEINAFLSSLATDGRVAASTQNQALSALVFLYRHVLEKPFPEMPDLVRARTSTSPATRSSCATARARRTASRCFRRAHRQGPRFIGRGQRHSRRPGSMT